MSLLQALRYLAYDSAENRGLLGSLRACQGVVSIIETKADEAFNTETVQLAWKVVAAALAAVSYLSYGHDGNRAVCLAGGVLTARLASMERRKMPDKVSRTHVCRVSRLKRDVKDAQQCRSRSGMCDNFIESERRKPGAWRFQPLATG